MVRWRQDGRQRIKRFATEEVGVRFEQLLGPRRRAFADPKTNLRLPAPSYLDSKPDAGELGAIRS